MDTTISELGVDSLRKMTYLLAIRHGSKDSPYTVSEVPITEGMVANSAANHQIEISLLGVTGLMTSVCDRIFPGEEDRFAGNYIAKINEENGLLVSALPQNIHTAANRQIILPDRDLKVVVPINNPESKPKAPVGQIRTNDGLIRIDPKSPIPLDSFPAYSVQRVLVEFLESFRKTLLMQRNK